MTEYPDTYLCRSHALYSEKYGVLEVGDYDFEDPEFHQKINALSKECGDTIHLVKLEGMRFDGYHSKYEFTHNH